MSDRIAVMSAGHVQQIGTAREIYETPVNRFVADFIGETNLLEVEVTAVSGDRAQVALPGGQVITLAAAGQGKGRHHLSIRPERMALGQGGELEATVERVVYLGTDLQLLVRLMGGQEMSVRLQNSTRTEVPSPGTKVSLHIEEGAARLLAD